MTTMTIETLTAIAAAANIDLNAHGTKRHFGRMLGVDGSAVQLAVRTGRVSAGLAAAARKFADGLADGSVSLPAAATHAANPAATAAALLAVDPDAELSDDELTAKINDRFTTMMRMVDHAIAGRFASVLVTGPGGIGKTFPIENRLQEYVIDRPQACVVYATGGMSAVGLVEALWNTRNKGDVLVIDDADAGMADLDFLNVLKAATDSKPVRRISWLKQNRQLAEAGVEQEFEFAGAVIIISNADYKAKAAKGNGHIDAILSRALHIDLGINSTRALSLRVRHMLVECDMLGQLFASMGMADLHEQAKEEIAHYIETNRSRMRSLTLREATKLGQIYCAEMGGMYWTKIAENTLGA